MQTFHAQPHPPSPQAGWDGVFVVNKPPGLTSHDVVLLMRQRLSIRKVGHAGTLDPMARGVLVVLVGTATKSQHLLQAHRKTYETLIQLGMATETGDAWGRPVQTAPVPALDAAHVARVLASFVGRITQTPPRYSAVKVGGRPLYWWARRGVPMAARPRTVEIVSLDLLECAGDHVRCRITCSTGTYIRSLAETIATALGTVGHVRELVRLSVGPWDLAQALDVGWLSCASLDDLRSALRSLEVVDARA